jgi:transposase
VSRKRKKQKAVALEVVSGATVEDVVREEGRASELPDSEVLAGPKRRTFTAAYKQRILDEADACTEPGQVGALLRREGLYSSHLSSWRQASKRGEREALSAKRGPKERTISEREHKRLVRENEKLKRELATARLVIDAQKKLAEVLGVALPPPPEGT